MKQFVYSLEIEYNKIKRVIIVKTHTPKFSNNKRVISGVKASMNLKD